MSELYENLIEYANSDYYPFHMPGHKRKNINDISPYTYDITEIDGFDNLHEPQGIIRLALEEAKAFYESDKTYFLVNGSTCGLLSAICGATSKKDKVIVARNCHKSVYNAIYLNELHPVYIYPENIEEFGINGGILPETVNEAIIENPDAKVVIITSPTYEGIVSDIDKIAEIVHRNNMILIVDEAHGAHFGMHMNLPKNALSNGADMVIQSLHKTLPALTQTALLHIKGNRVNKDKVENFLKIYQTSSPSYVLMSSITECINKIKKDGMFLFEPYVKRLLVVHKHANELTHIKLIGRDIVGKDGVYDFDLSKLVFSVKGTGYSGKWLYEKLLNEYHLQLEMALGDYVIAMTSVMDEEEGLLRLFKALAEIDREIRIENYGREDKNDLNYSYIVPKAIAIQSVYDAINSDKEYIPFNLSEGKISAEYIYLYPPGVPMLAPGELITGDILALVSRYKKSGFNVYGLKDREFKNIEVIKEGFRAVNLVRGFYSQK